MRDPLLLVLVVIVAVLLLGGSAPVWPHSRSWGYTPLSIIALVLLVVLLLSLFR